MVKQSAGILAYRFQNDDLEVLLVHPGGPFFAKKDSGVWSIPKGEFTTEEPLEAAIREFGEELGKPVSGEFTELKPVKLKSGKTVYAWTIAADIDVTDIKSNNFSMEWPPKSGRMQEFPEVDRAEWFTTNIARDKINPAQADFIDQLIRVIESQ